MGKYAYKISIEALGADSGRIEFETDSHDDILALASRVAKGDARTLRFLVGLKLFGEALREGRDTPLYRDFLPHFGEFMKRLKTSAVKLA
jgi:hypothetical protein